jgi:thiol-disulfide isomerase/thioredoxin
MQTNPFRTNSLPIATVVVLFATVTGLCSLRSVNAADAIVAPAFTLPTQTAAVTLSDLRGKVVLVDFWASWCGPCRQSFPWMNEMHEKYHSQGMEIIAINVDQEAALAAEFLTALPANFTVAFDPEGKTAEAFNVMGMPSAYLIDQTGKIHSQHIGFHNDQKTAYEAAIASLLKP